MNSYETVNNILVRLFKDILDIEERALITSEYKDISVNDMHIMEAIGIQETKDLTKALLKLQRFFDDYGKE